MTAAEELTSERTQDEADEEQESPLAVRFYDDTDTMRHVLDRLKAL